MNPIENEPASTGSAAPEDKIREVHHHHYHERRHVNSGRILLGMLVIIVGLGYLARNTGWLPGISIDWSLLWPILVIVVGLSLLSGRGWLNLIFGGLVTLIVSAAVILMLVGRSAGGTGMINGWYGQWLREVPQAQDQGFSIAKESAAKRASVEVRGGAGLISINGGSSDLAEGKLLSNFATIVTSSKISGDRQEAVIRADGDGHIMLSRGWKNDLRATITHEVPVDLSVDGGAATLQLDLTRVIAESVKINTGASKVSLALGDKAARTDVEVKAGASSLEMELPKSSGAKVVLKSALTSTDFPGFEKIGDETYATPDYEKAAKKIDITLELGASSVKIRMK